MLSRISNFEPDVNTLGGLQIGIRYGGKGSAVEVSRNPEEAAYDGSYMTKAEYDSNVRILKIVSLIQAGARRRQQRLRSVGRFARRPRLGFVWPSAGSVAVASFCAAAGADCGLSQYCPGLYAS